MTLSQNVSPIGLGQLLSIPIKQSPFQARDHMILRIRFIETGLGFPLYFTPILSSPLEARKSPSKIPNQIMHEVLYLHFTTG